MIMKTTFIYTLVAGAIILSLAACNKEQNNQEENAGLVTESLSAQKENDATKVTMNSSRVFGWSGSDQAAFSAYNGASYTFYESDTYGATVADKFTVSYSGTRQGYAVIPSNFAKSLSADGSTLTVTYPDSYDISAYVDAADALDEDYDGANGTDFIPYPMVAVSSSGNPSLTFYAIGALVKVSVSEVPAGTKKLFITFNKKVTGDFEVQDLSTLGTTNQPYVSTDVDAYTNVSVTISSTGLTKTRNITMYIPVPLCDAGLNLISSKGAAKAALVRNKGYAFAVKAIDRVSSTTEFKMRINGVDWNYFISPGNLLAHNTGSGIEWSFLDGNGGYDQLITVENSIVDNPHQNHAFTPGRANSGDYQDSFLWDDLYDVFEGSPQDPAGAGTISTGKTISGNTWYIPRNDNFSRFILNYGSFRTGESKNYVGGVGHACYSQVNVYVGGSAYSSYELENTLHVVSGLMLYPDGFVDQTGFVTNVNSSAIPEIKDRPVISFEAFKSMVDAGAKFLPAGGACWEVENVWTFGQVGSECAYWTGKAIDATTAYRLYSNLNMTSGLRAVYRNVRLVRAEEIESLTTLGSFIPSLEEEEHVVW